MNEENKNQILSRNENDSSNLLVNVEQENIKDNTNIKNDEAKENEEIRKKLSNFRVFMLFVTLSLALFGVIIWQIVSLFMNLNV